MTQLNVSSDGYAQNLTQFFRQTKQHRRHTVNNDKLSTPRALQYIYFLRKIVL